MMSSPIHPGDGVRRAVAAGVAAAGVAAAGVAAALLCAAAGTALAAAPVFDYRVVGVYPHDSQAYTQGLIAEGEFLYEGTGGYGRSSLRKVELETGIIWKRHDLHADYFGEGITALRDTIYQLTWNNRVGFSYLEQDTFALLETFAYPWEGWGLTHNDTVLIASSGSATLRFLDPRTRELISQIEVQEDGAPIYMLNELEYIQGRIYSNVWYSDRIAIIDPASGDVDAWLDLSGLRDSVAHDPHAGVLNGIAYDPVAARLFVTGKRWPKLFEIDVPPLHPEAVEDIARPAPPAGPVLRCLPNPCRLRTQLSGLPAGGGISSLVVFDAAGRCVRALSGDPRAAGAEGLTLDVGGLPAGAYFVRVGTEHGIQRGVLSILR